MRRKFDAGAGVDLADMFGELKHELEEDVASADEDPETHYNLGVAFREMGLLDEAIGELQKVCQADGPWTFFPASDADLHLAGAVLPGQRRSEARNPAGMKGRSSCRKSIKKPHRLALRTGIIVRNLRQQAAGLE